MCCWVDDQWNFDRWWFKKDGCFIDNCDGKKSQRSTLQSMTQENSSCNFLNRVICIAKVTKTIELLSFLGVMPSIWLPQLTNYFKACDQCLYMFSSKHRSFLFWSVARQIWVTMHIQKCLHLTLLIAMSFESAMVLAKIANSRSSLSSWW